MKVEGESADYTLSLTFDEDHPTCWFHVEVSGHGADEASLEKSDAGYVLKADRIGETTVMVSNKDRAITLTFTPDADKDITAALIYEISETTVGIRIDTDGDGTFDRLIVGEEAAPAYLPGDVNDDGLVTAEDARYTLRAAVGLDDTADGLDFSDPNNRCALAADVDGEKGITAADARLILRAAVGLDKLS